MAPTVKPQASPAGAGLPAEGALLQEARRVEAALRVLRPQGPVASVLPVVPGVPGVQLDEQPWAEWLASLASPMA
jgi:hypothetical protein